MKTYNKPATSKLVKRFDNELIEILKNDLKAFAVHNPFLARNKQEKLRASLSVA